MNTALTALSKYKAFLSREHRYLEHQMMKLDPTWKGFTLEYRDLNKLGMDAASRAEAVLKAIGIDPQNAD